MSTTRQLPALTPWRALHRMWRHFATRWEQPTKVEQTITQTRKACERDFEERLRKWRRIWFDEGYQQAVKDLPICRVQPAAQPAPLLGARARSLARQRLISAPSTYEPPEKRTDPLPTRHQPDDPDDTEEYKALSQLLREGRGKAS